MDTLLSSAHTIKSEALLTCLTAKNGDGTGNFFGGPLILSIFAQYYVYPSVIFIYTTTMAHQTITLQYRKDRNTNK